MESNDKATPTNTPNGNVAAEPKKRSKVFLIILIGMLALGAWFGFTKYKYALHNEDTDDAQVEADISPVIPRVSGYMK